MSIERIGYLTCLAVFIILPPVLLLCHVRFKHRFTWPAVILLDAFFGWLAINACLWLYEAELSRIINNTPNPPAELWDKLQSDGAANIFTLILGWAYALAYFLFIWIFPYLLVPRVLRLFARD
jgi:hypothetical protein